VIETGSRVKTFFKIIENLIFSQVKKFLRLGKFMHLENCQIVKKQKKWGMVGSVFFVVQITY